MAKNGFKIIDSELHLLEPYEQWEQRLPEPFRSRTRIAAPPNRHLDTGHVNVDLDGKGFAGFTAAESKRSPTYRQGNRKWVASPEMAKVHRDPSPATWIEGMDIEGIDVAILTPTIGFHLMNIDGVAPDHALALCRVYNDCTAEFASVDPERFKFWGWLPRQAPELAAAEARRCVEELGAVGVSMTSGGVDGTILTDPQFEQLWQETERLGVPFGLHVFGNTAMADDLRHRYAGHPRTEIVSSTMRQPFYSQTALAELILGGVLDAHPRLRIVIQEANVAWLPWLLWRMDEKWETYGPDQDYTLSLKPSQYFRRQCYAVVDADESVAQYAIDYLGDENLLWSSDFPHHDSSFPDASNIFLGLSEISEESKRRILWDNGAQLFGLTKSARVPVGAR